MHKRRWSGREFGAAAAAFGGAHRVPANCWYRWRGPQLSGAASARHPARPRAGGALRTQQLARGCKQALAIRQAAPAGRGWCPPTMRSSSARMDPLSPGLVTASRAPQALPLGRRAVAHWAHEREVQSSWWHAGMGGTGAAAAGRSEGYGRASQPCNPACTSLLLCLAQPCGAALPGWWLAAASDERAPKFAGLWLHTNWLHRCVCIYRLQAVGR